MAKQWTADDIAKIWNTTENTAQATPQPAPVPVLKSKLNYEVKPYENKTYTAADIEKIWKNVDRGNEKQAEMKAKANDKTPARFNKVPTKEELSRRNLAEGLDSASKSLNKDLKSIDRRNLTREEEAKLKKQEREEKTAKQARAKELNNVSKNMGDTNADRYNSRLSLNKPTNNNKVNDQISVSYNKANKKEEIPEIKRNLDKEAKNYFNTKDKTRENMLNNRKNEKQFVKDMANTYGYSKDEVKDYLKDYKNQALMTDYLVSRDRYDQLMQDGRFRNAFEPLAKALSTSQGTKGRGVREIEGMGYNSVNDYIDQLSKRYELTSDEIKDIYKTYSSDREKAQAEKLSEGMYKLGQKNKVMGTLMPLTYKGAAGVEGWYNVLNSLTTGDDRNQSHIFNAMANASQQGVADTMDSELAKNIYNFGVGGASAAMNAAAGAMGIAAQSGNAANEALNSAIERGINPLQAGVYGGLAGGSDYLFNRVGFNAIEQSIGQQSITNAKGIVLKALTNFGIEGAENVAQDAVQSVADGILNGDNSELNNAYAEYIESGLSPKDAFAKVAVDYAKQLGGSFVQGGFGGAIFGGIKGDYRYDDGSSLANRAAGKVMEYKANKKSQAVQDRVKASEIEDVKQDIEKFSNAAQEAIATGDVQTAETLAQTVERLNTKLADLEGEPTAEVPRVGKQPSLIVENNAEVPTNETESVPVAEDYITNLRNTVKNAEPIDKADLLVDGGYYADMQEAGKAFKDGTLDADVERYLSLMEKNGDPTPTKPVVSENDYDRTALEEKYNGDWTAMRKGTIKEYTGASDEKVDQYYKELDKFFSGSGSSANAEILDDYVAHAPAYKGEMRRGMHFGLEDGEYDKFMAKVHDGSIVTLDKPSSWASDWQVARRFSHLRDPQCDSIEIVCNQNRTSTPVSFANFHGEDEILSSSKASWTVLKEDTAILDSGARKTILYVAETGDKTPPKDAVTIPEEGSIPNESVETEPTLAEINTRRSREISLQAEEEAFQRSMREMQNEAPAETPNKNMVMAEDIGLNPKTRLDDESNVIGEELEPRNPYKKDGVSQFATNTMINTKVFDADTIENNATIKDMAKLVKEGHTDVDTFNGAMERVTSDGDKWMNDIIDGKYVLGADKDKADLDFDTGMVLLTGLRDAIDLSTDPAEISALTAKRDLLYGKMQTFSTSAARILHAHRKWNNTAEGLTMAGNQLLGDQTDVWSTRNKNEVEKNQKIADDLSKIGKKNTEEKLPINKKLNTAIKDLSAVKKPNDDGTEKTHEQLVQEIENTLKKHNMYDQYKDRIDVLANYVENIPTWQLTDQLRHFAQTGEFYTVDESTPLAREKSSKLVRAFKEQGDKTPKAEKQEIGFAKRKQRIINTLEDELGSIEGLFPDEAINQLVDLEEKLSPSELIDEIEHYLEHGEFYPITEDVPQNLPKMGALTNMLDRIVSDGSMQKAAKEPDTFEQTLEKVRNTFEDESSAFAGQFNDNDYYFIATMFQEGVPKWQIEDELRYKMKTGNWYSIDESIREPRVQNQKLKNAIKTRSEGEKVPVEKEPLTFEELQEQVKNTFLANRLENMTDDDVDYIAGMMQAGATTKEIAQALNTKAATGRFGMSTEAQNEISRLYKYMDKLDPESKEYVEAQMEAFRIAANEVKSSASAVEKFDAWRYLAMLGNPKTMVRNFVGNTMFNVVTGFSNNVAAMGESALRLKNRTKAVLNPVKDRALMKATKEDFNNKRYASGAGDKYHSYQSGIEGATSAFDSHVMQFLEDLTNRGISDTRFVRAKYGTSLAGYMKANGLTQKDLEDSYKYDGLRKLQRNKNRLMTKEELAELERTKPIAEKMEKARDYALEQAKYATFHEDNVFADKLSQHINDWKKGEIKLKDGTVIHNNAAKALGYALDGILPFRKTPANILKSGYEYSPLGVIKSAGDTLKLVYENTGKRKNYADTYYNRKGELVHKTVANDVIEDWSKNLTGSLMSMLGYYLFSKGILKDSDKDTKYQDSLEGLQNYSIEINGKTYTVDWAAPACMPLLLGAEVAKIHRDNGISDKKFYDDPERYWEVANRMFEPLVETSMLQGVKDTLETAANAAKYNEELSVPMLLAYNSLTGYATQAIPTLSGQVSRLIDPTRRSTYTERDGIGGIVEKQVRKTMNKTPLSRLNQPYYDTYGRTQSNNPFEYSERFADEPLKNIGRGIGNALYQFASPSYIQNVNTTDADAMTREVYEAIKKDDEDAAKVFGQWQSVKKIDGQRVSDEDYAKFAQKRGEIDYEIRDALAHDEWFKMLDNDEKAKILKGITGVANKVGEAEINPNFTTKDTDYKAYTEGGVKGLIDEYKDSIHNDRVKNELGTSSDFAKELYDSGDQKRLDLYKQGNAIAEQYGYDTLSEEEFLNYEKYGEAKLNKILNYKATAKELGVNNNDTFKKLVDSGVSKESIKQASDAITSTQFGKDEFGRDQYLPFSQETYDVYKSHGTAGLKDYAKIKQGKANYKTYYQAQKALPTLIKNADSYVKMFNALDGKAGSKADGEISQNELFQYFNGRDMTQAQVNAYWNAFGKISGDDAWKSVPVLKYDKKAGKTIWKAEKKK